MGSMLPHCCCWHSCACSEHTAAPPLLPCNSLTPFASLLISARPSTFVQPGERAGSLRNPKLSTSWEKKMKVKAEETAFKEAKRAAVAARKEAAAEERRRREEAKVGWGEAVWGQRLGGGRCRGDGAWEGAGWQTRATACLYSSCRRGSAPAVRLLPAVSVVLLAAPPRPPQARKEAKRAAAAVTTRVSAATAKRMMKNKKQRKLLKTGDA